MLHALLQTRLVSMARQLRHLPNSSRKTTSIMSASHAVILVDHHSARLQQFTAEDVLRHTMHEELKFTRQYHSAVRTEHEFFSQVCDALDDIPEVLVVGGHTGLAAFRRYVEKHRPLTAPCIVGYEVVDHPTDRQLVALARRYFIKPGQVVSTPTSS